MESQIKLIKELGLLVLSHRGLDVADILSLTMTGHVKLHNGEIHYITADLAGCIVEEQDHVSGNQQTTAPAAAMQVPNPEDLTQPQAHHQQQNQGQKSQHACAPAAGFDGSMPDNQAHAASQPFVAATVGVPAATQPAAAVARVPMQPHTSKRKAVNLHLGGRDQTSCKKANREQQQESNYHQPPPQDQQVSAEDDHRDPRIAAAAAAVFVSGTVQDESMLASSEYGKADSQQTSSTTTEAVLSTAHAGQAPPAVASMAEAAIMSAFGPVEAEQCSKQPQVCQHAPKQHKQLNRMSGVTTTALTVEAAAWPVAQVIPAAAGQQTHNTVATYKCAFKTLPDTKPRSKGKPPRFLFYIQTPNMTKFRYIRVATDAVCKTIEAECGRATCWDDVYQVLQEYCTHEMCQKLAQLHAEVVE